MEIDIRHYRKKNYEELELKDDFMFGKVMQDRELCKKTLEMLLEMPIKEIVSLEKQKDIKLISGRKGIRLDIYVQDMDKTVYDAEMQQQYKREEEENLPKRIRYYQGLIDLDILEKGEKYQELGNSYVIFICTFDPFGKGRSRYTFENVCLEDKELHLNDGAVKIFFNTKGNKEDVNLETQKLLEYLDGKTVGNELTRKLDEAVEEVRRNEKWRLEYMKERFIFMEAREDGRRDGLEEGRKESELNMAKMMVKNVDAAIYSFHVDLLGACAGLGLSLEEYEKAKELIQSREE